MAAQETTEASTNVNGIGLRDWFAGQALMGMMADPDSPFLTPKCAKVAYEYADAMLEARKESRS